ncbi:hypothetical protein [Hydrocarboniphaga effusa]|jgi:hypothetical protein|uniref:hypothetical protein n=1 Tax=Hydrocarboniphaga effusa TaxID=243629 RepID=UPI003BAD9F13
MSAETPGEVAERVAKARNTMSAIDYGSGFSDKEYPEIIWSMCGLTKTSEIVVMAEVGDLKIGKAHRSGLSYPHMVDRIFGIDIDDQRLALWLSSQLWDSNANQLITEALRVRAKT